MQTPEELMQHIEKCLSGIEGEPGHEKVVLDCGLGAELIRARDAEIRRECAERAEEWRVNLGPGDDEASTLRAAITGEEE